MTRQISGAKRCAMKIFGAAKFRAQCLTLLDNLGPEGIIITKHGKPGGDE